MIEHNIIKNKKNNLIIEGQRIFLREINLSDANRNYCSWMNDAKANQYLESRFEKWSVRRLKNYVKEIKINRDNFFWAIMLKETGRHIGNIKLGPINRKHGFADLGIIIGEKPYWGKGFATEAITLVVDYAFEKLKLNKLTAGAYANNVASIKAFKKAGFKKETLMKQHYCFEGKYIDGVGLCIINKKGVSLPR